MILERNIQLKNRKDEIVLAIKEVKNINQNLTQSNECINEKHIYKNGLLFLSEVLIDAIINKVIQFANEEKFMGY